MIEIHAFGEVTQIRLSAELDGKALYWVAAYLVDGLLIDTGCSRTAEELVAFLRNRPPAMAVNTHFHEDHVGGNSAVMECFGIDIYAHPDSIPRIAERPSLYPYQELVWGYPRPTVVKPIHDVIRTMHHEFTVVEIPGHCEGHIALMELSRGWCFSGDIFTRERVKFIRPEENARAQISSMKKILSIAGSGLTLFTALGRVEHDGRRVIEECIANMEALGHRVKALSGEGCSTGEIVEIVFGGESGFSDLTNGQFSSKNLVISLLDEG